MSECSDLVKGAIEKIPELDGILFSLSRFGFDLDYEKNPIHKATETELVKMLNTTRDLGNTILNVIGDISYELAWRRATRRKRDQIIFREHKL